MPLSLSDLQAHPESYLGPVIAGLFIEAILTGILLKQCITFMERAERESTAVCLVVAFVCSVALFQMALSYYRVWDTFVLHFGNWVATMEFTWCEKLQSMLTTFMASPVQAFLIWRCWVLMDYQWLMLVPLSILLLLSVFSSVIVTVETFQIEFTVYTTAVSTPRIETNIPYILTLASSAGLDVAVTAILLIYLARAKHVVISSRFRRTLKKLTILIWEAAIPPTACALATLVTYLSLVNYNYWNLACQALLGKLYVISLFVSLNGRADLGRDNMFLDCSQLSFDVLTRLNNLPAPGADPPHDPDMPERNSSTSVPESTLNVTEMSHKTVLPSSG